MFVLSADADGVPARQQGLCRGEKASSGLLGKNGRALGTHHQDRRAQVTLATIGVHTDTAVGVPSVLPVTSCRLNNAGRRYNAGLGIPVPDIIPAPDIMPI